MSDISQSAALREPAPATLGIPGVVEATILGRRSVKAFRDEPVPRRTLARLIEAAVWAPNHRLTEPWRFYVLDRSSRARLGAIAARIAARKLAQSGADEATVARKAAEAGAPWAAVPALILVTMVSDANPEVDLENYGAVCCAIQNLTLLAHALGLGTSWSSGAVAAADELKALAGARDGERMVGLLRVGYADPGVPVPRGQRTPSSAFVTWVDQDDA